MKTRIYSILTGFVITLLISGGAFLYLAHLKNKKAFQAQSPYIDIVETMDQRFNDLKYKFSEKQKPADNVVLIAVDDASLKEIGRWPWSRDVTSELVQKLIDYKVKSVGMDIIFSEPEKAAPENDIQLGKVIEANSGQVVLGTFSENFVQLRPYQDYCVNEAFLSNGGDKLLKLTASFVVDDVGDEYADLPWDELFAPLFQNIKKKTERAYLHEVHKKGTDELTQFQKNYLAALKTSETFKYCSRWLTPSDEFQAYNNAELMNLYGKLFRKRLKTEKTLSSPEIEQQIAIFRSNITELPIPQYGEWQGNIPAVQDPSQYTGSFVVHPDLDGYVRRYPLFYRSGNKIGTSFIPSIALQTYLVATGYRADVTIEKIKDRKAITSFTIKDPSVEPEKLIQELPVDSQGRLVINFYGKAQTLPYVSAKDLFSDDDDIMVTTRESENEYGQIRLHNRQMKKADFFKDKTVLVGPTAIAIYDLRNTPMAANYPGPEIHLTVLANLFSQHYITRLKKELGILPISLLLVGFLFSVLLTFLGPTQSVAAMVVAVPMFFWADKFIFEKFHVLYASLFFVIEIPCVFLSILVYKYSTEERKKNELRKMFSKYVSPAVVDELLKSEENLKLGGRKQEMSVFFSDVRGFTEFSEKMDPQDLSTFLNEYLTPMTEMVFNNKGTLDKYMGDGLMAFFGAPIAFEDHAYSACKCALQSMEHLKKLQAEFSKRNWPKIDIGIGINTGFMSVGNMGSKIVQSYTVIGDAVNLGSRLEAANKEYGTHILISESTYSAAKDRIVAREVDLVRVKGKKVPIKTYELIAESADEKTQAWLKEWEKAYTSYQKQHFEVAKHQFAQIERDYPHDSVAKVYRKRCEHFIEEPPVSDWDGVYEMKTK